MSSTQHAVAQRGARPTRRLSRPECREWLVNHHQGRLGYATGRGPRSVVVNYALAGDQVVFRLPDYNDIVRYAPGERVTLEVEGVHASVGDFETVIVTGQAELAGEPSAEAEVALDEEWPSGVSTHVLCLPMTQVEGFEHEAAPDSD